MSRYWTDSDNPQGYEFETFDEAFEYFQQQFAEKHGLGEHTDKMTVVLYDFDTDEAIEERDIDLYCENLRSDYEEHNTHWGL